MSARAIVTVAGPVLAVDGTHCLTLRVLPCEHVLRPITPSGDSVALLNDLTLSRLSQVRRDPTSLPANLHYEPPQSVRDLTVGSTAAPMGTVLVDMGGMGVAPALLAWSQHDSGGVLSGVVASTSPSAAGGADDKQRAASLVVDLVVGSPVGLRAGVIVVDVNGGADLDWQLNVRSAAMASAQTGAPMVLKAALGAGCEAMGRAVQVAKDTAGHLGRVVVANVAWLGDDLPSCMVAIRSWLQMGVGAVCWSPLGSGLFLRTGCVVLSDDEVVRCVAVLVGEGHVDRLWMSAGVTYRSMLTKYGGYGFMHAHEGIAQRLGLVLPQADIDKIHGNPLKMLAWWTPPVVKPKEIITWKCDYCAKEGTDKSEQFAKFNYVYCSIKCLGAHRQKMQG